MNARRSPPIAHPSSAVAHAGDGQRRPASRAEAEGGERASSEDEDERVAAARQALLEGVGAEIAASFPGITRLGGQVVAALYLADEARSMDELSVELGRSK